MALTLWLFHSTHSSYRSMTNTSQNRFCSFKISEAFFTATKVQAYWIIWMKRLGHFWDCGILWRECYEYAWRGGATRHTPVTLFRMMTDMQVRWFKVNNDLRSCNGRTLGDIKSARHVNWSEMLWIMWIHISFEQKFLWRVFVLLSLTGGEAFGGECQQITKYII